VTGSAPGGKLPFAYDRGNRAELRGFAFSGHQQALAIVSCRYRVRR
jgi:hypothetical protein